MFNFKINELKNNIKVGFPIHSLDKYISHIREDSHNMTAGLSEKYMRLIMSYNNGNYQPLLSNLYERILALDELRKSIASDIKTLLSEK